MQPRSYTFDNPCTHHNFLVRDGENNRTLVVTFEFKVRDIARTPANQPAPVSLSPLAMPKLTAIMLNVFHDILIPVANLTLKIMILNLKTSLPKFQCILC